MSNSILAKMAVQITANAAQFNTTLAQTNKRLDSFSHSVSSLGKTLIAGFGIYEIGRGIIDVTSQFQKFEAVLTNTLGDSSRAQKALRDIEAFAQNTPFQVDEVTAAYVRWANQGLDPTISRMGKLGDIASSLGAGFEQTAEAFKDLMVGQTKRIEEIGISAQQSNGKIQLSFKGVNIEIEKNAEGVQKALDVYSQLNGVLGTSDAVSKTLGGRISNLKDSWDQLLKTIGEGNSGILYDTVNIMTRLVQGLNFAGLQVRLFTKGVKGISDLDFEKLMNFGETESLKKISDVLKSITSQSNSDFFANINKNMKEFVSLLVKEGETQSDAIDLWVRYVKVRVKGTEADAEAAKQERLNAFNESVKAAKERYDAAVKETEAKNKLVLALRQEAIERSKNREIIEGRLKIEPPTVAGFDTSQINFKGDGSGNAIAGVQAAITKATLEANEAQKEQINIIMQQREAWASLGSQMSDVIAATIASGEPLLNSLARITSGVIDQLQQITLARMVADSSKFGIAGILAAAAGFGVVKGLFAKISRSGRGGGGGGGGVSGGGRGSYSSVNQASMSSILSTSNQQVVLVGGEIRVRGSDMYVALENARKERQRTGG